jgi:two-component system, NarL family, sensor kinase
VIKPDEAKQPKYYPIVARNRQRSEGKTRYGGFRRRIPKDAALCLYRVAQESLRNISKHAADAKDVAISLTGDSDRITLEVRDSGRGFESDEALRKGGLGFITMEERLRLVHGELKVRSEPGTGTVITAFVPLRTQT